jgi:hypothetical protein
MEPLGPTFWSGLLRSRAYRLEQSSAFLLSGRPITYQENVMSESIWQNQANQVRKVAETFDLTPSQPLVQALYPHASDATRAVVLAALNP